MKLRTAKKAAAVFLIIALIASLMACSGKQMQGITVDTDGIASWERVKGAVQYEYVFVDANYTSSGEVYYTIETSVLIPEGFSVHVRAVFENGQYGDWMVSDYFGEPVVLERDDDPVDDDPVDDDPVDDDPVDDDPVDEVYKDLVDSCYSIAWEDLKTYEIISNIKYDTVKVLADGSVYFETEAPNGAVMRFVGTGVTVTEGAIRFAPDGQITALDAIGRICVISPAVSDPGSDGNWINFTGGYTFTDANSVDSADELFFIWPIGAETALFSTDTLPYLSLLDYQPNFIAFGASNTNVDAFTVSALTVYYDETTFNTGIRLMALDVTSYGTYLEGEYYDPAREIYDLENRIYDFDMCFLPDLADELVSFQPDPLVDSIASRSIVCINTSRYTIGALKDAEGNVLDKNNAKLSIGCTLEVTLGDYTMDFLLPVTEQFTGAQTLHELAPYNNAFAEGEVTALVVPVFWQDQPENATDEFLEELYAKLGRVLAADGTVTDYSDGMTDSFSLSEYYDIASYGKYKITSFVTDWYAAPYNFIGDMENTNAGNEDLGKGIYEWLMNTYPNMDWSQFDRDADGFFDSVIYVNVGVEEDDETIMASYSYAVHQSMGYTGDGAGTQEQPKIKNFISMNVSFLGGNTLIHEYAHNFGLVDYYDVTYSGIDAVGSYDMQSGNYGDWNAYSKYAVGWIEPEVVEGLSSGQSVEITIGSFSKTGDAIVIPAAGTEHDGPFSEYILIDLFTDDGVNAYDAEMFGLVGVNGVRIYHISSPMEKRVLTGANGTEYPIGTVHYANAYNEDGKYLIELLQAGGVNTFTVTDIETLRPRLRADDLFQQGDVFTAEKYASFLKDGRMDDGSAFGYTVEIVSISTDANGDVTATIRITRQ